MTGSISSLVTIAVCIAAGILLRNYNIKRVSDGQVIEGVCAGLAKAFKIQAFWIRLAFVICSFFFGGGVLAYIILWICMEKE
ncbi:PspC domain-containing protein [Candidatus Falkowbacteria bacterium]|nr:PspC domain-containing protein [Candidatus Falkowbacteria bacterium]